LDLRQANFVLVPEVVKEGVARDEDLRNSTELLEVEGKDEAISYEA
jgi:hypothetical protein